MLVIEYGPRPAVYLFGLPGSGKSTLATTLYKTFTSSVVLSGGALLRQEERRAQGRWVDVVKDAIACGREAPDELVVGLYSAELKRRPGVRYAFLDGSPGSVEQFMEINAVLATYGFDTSPPLMILLDPPDEERHRRLTMPRFLCRECYAPLSEQERCELCGGAPKEREIPSKRIAANRVSWHCEITLNLFQSAPADVVLRIDGAPSPDECARTVTRWLDCYVHSR